MQGYLRRAPDQRRTGSKSAERTGSDPWNTLESHHFGWWCKLGPLNSESPCTHHQHQEGAVGVREVRAKMHARQLDLARWRRTLGVLVLTVLPRPPRAHGAAILRTVPAPAGVTITGVRSTASVQHRRVQHRVVTAKLWRQTVAVGARVQQHGTRGAGVTIGVCARAARGIPGVTLPSLLGRAQPQKVLVHAPDHVVQRGLQRQSTRVYVDHLDQAQSTRYIRMGHSNARSGSWARQHQICAKYTVSADAVCIPDIIGARLKEGVVSSAATTATATEIVEHTPE